MLIKRRRPNSNLLEKNETYCLLLSKSYDGGRVMVWYSECICREQKIDLVIVQRYQSNKSGVEKHDQPSVHHAWYLKARQGKARYHDSPSGR